MNQTDIKELKSLCKKGLVPMPDVFGLIIKHLQTEHCQVRISSFQVGSSFFHFTKLEALVQSILNHSVQVSNQVYTYMRLKTVLSFVEVVICNFQILDELFQRSHAIRELTLEKLKTIVSLTLALELSDNLPPPRKFQSTLKVG